MILLAWRYLRLIAALIATMAIFLGREARPIIVGGYSKNDPRNPRQVALRVAKREHDLMLPGPYSHHEDCPYCAPQALPPGTRRRERYNAKISERIQNDLGSKSVLWRCLECEDRGNYETHQYISLLMQHWVDHGHVRYAIPVNRLTAWRDHWETMEKDVREGRAPRVAYENYMFPQDAIRNAIGVKKVRKF
jgi:hypothetical protein